MKEIRDMTYSELLTLREEINKEIDRQYREQAHKAWLVVTNAIKTYTEKYGSLSVTDSYGDTVYINENSDFDTIGEIMVQ